MNNAHVVVDTLLKLFASGEHLPYNDHVVVDALLKLFASGERWPYYDHVGADTLLQRAIFKQLALTVWQLWNDLYRAVRKQERYDSRKLSVIQSYLQALNTNSVIGVDWPSYKSLRTLSPDVIPCGWLDLKHQLTDGCGLTGLQSYKICKQWALTV